MSHLADPIAVLKAEHETILDACRTTDTIARLLLQHQAVAPDILFEQVQFFRQVVDGQHRHREQDLLFPLLQKKHIGTDAVNQSLLAYQEGRFWIRSMEQLAEAYQHGCATAGRRWAETITNYVLMLRSQIEAESRFVLPLAEHVLQAGEQEFLAAEYVLSGTPSFVSRCG